MFKDINTENERRIKFYEKNLLIGESVLIYGVPRNLKGFLFVVFKLLNKELFKYSIFRNDEELKLITESDFKYISWRAADINGMKLFKKIDKLSQKDIDYNNNFLEERSAELLRKSDFNII